MMDSDLQQMWLDKGRMTRYEGGWRDIEHVVRVGWMMPMVEQFGWSDSEQEV